MLDHTVFVTDNDQGIRELYRDILCAEGYLPEVAAPHAISAGSIAAAHPDVALLELLPGAPSTTLALVEQLRASPLTAGTPVVLMTTCPRLLAQLAAPLSRLGCATMLKPFQLDELLACVKQAVASNPKT